MFRFDFDKADLNQHNRELLSRISGILLISKGYGLSVFGYTDDVGTAEYNQQLSLRRAAAVKDYLVQAGIDPAIINVKGYGKTSPLSNTLNNDARAKNRARGNCPHRQFCSLLRTNESENSKCGCPGIHLCQSVCAKPSCQFSGDWFVEPAWSNVQCVRS